MDQEHRVVVLIDMDCFYCQVEEKLDPKLKGKPIAVVQYNPWQGGGIIAVNYVARAMGVTRHMRGAEAKKKCPEIQLPSVPCLRGKADISKYRDAGKEVARVLQKFTPLLERASIDEAYLDITDPVQARLQTLNVHAISVDMMPNTYALGYDGVEQFMADVHAYGSDSIEFNYEHAKRLLVGAVVVSEIRAAVFEETGYTCSAGIAHNKILAKLVCGMNKPNKQTILPKHSINILYKTLSVKKVKHLGGKFGDTVCEVLRISNMGELQKFSEKELQARFDEKNGTWLYNIARGIDLEPVQARFNPKSIGCCKQLRGKSALFDLDSLRKWLKDLGDEIEDRLEKDSLENNRTPKQMVVSFSTQLSKGRDASSSRSYNFAAEDDLCGDFFAAKALELVMDTAEGGKVKDDEPNRKLKAPIKFLGISVGKFEDTSESKTRKINDYFGAGSSNVTRIKDNVKQNETKDVTEKKDNKNKDGKEYILNKYFQATEKVSTKGNVKEETAQTVNDNKNKTNINKTEAVLESTLDKQESFFAKFLDRGLNVNKNSDSLKPMNESIKNTGKPTTPVCEIINRGEDSNDTDFSGSTINNEINKSIALFEEDPDDVSRVSSMREMLNKSAAVNDESDEMIQLGGEAEDKSKENTNEVNEGNLPPQTVETFECSECGKAISIGMFETHADYHLALKLREEERERVRNEKVKTKVKVISPKENVKKKIEKEDNKSKTDVNSSIATFFTKVDSTIPTEVCSECGKKIPLAKFGEHLDFHEAQKLNRELNKKTTSYFTGNSAKRKKSASPLKKPKMPCNSRSIDSFFR